VLAVRYWRHWGKILDVQPEASPLPFDNSQAIEIIREAAALSLTLRGQSVPVVKPDQTLVTEADQRLEAFLRERLGALAPGFSFLGEEGGLTGDPSAPCWIIDPIDGTTNFVRGIPLWCISVGVVHQGRAVWGCIAVPPQDEILWGSPGAGAWLGSLSSTDDAPQRLQAFDSDTLMQEDLIACNTMAEAAVDFKRVPCRLRNLGSLTYHLVALSRGALCCSLSRQHKLYDIAAGIAICHEAGCVSRYLNGEEWFAEVVAPREPMPLLVAPPQIMDILLQRLRLN
jgi:fructose-1,6-bisphosphatase/inositol monophosphatase family enzyme